MREGEDPAEFEARRAAAAKAAINAQRRLDDALFAQRQHGLEKQAAQERKELDAETKLKRRHFGDRLSALGDALAKEGATHEEANDRIQRLFKSFGVDYIAAGGALGGSFVWGFLEAGEKVRQAAAAVAQKIAPATAAVAAAGERSQAAAAHAAALATALKDVGDKAGKAGGALKGAADGGAAKLNAELPKMNAELASLDKPLKNLEIDTSGLTDAFDDLKGKFGPIGSGLKLIAGLSKAMGEAFVEGGKAFIDFGIKAPGMALELGKAILRGIIGGIKALPGVVADIAGWVKNRLMDGLEARIDAITGLGGWVVRRIVDGIKAIPDTVVAVGGWVKNRIRDGLEAVVDGFLGAGGWILHRIVEGVKATPDVILALGGWVKNRMREGLETVEDGFLNAGGWILGRVIAGIKALAEKVKDVVEWLKDQFVAAIRAVFSAPPYWALNLSPSKSFWVTVLTTPATASAP